MTKLLLALLINGSPSTFVIDYPTSVACENAKSEFTLAFSKNYKHSNADETIDIQGYEMFKNADVKIVSNICTNLNTGSIF